MTKRHCQGWHASQYAFVTMAGLLATSGWADDRLQRRPAAPPPPPSVAATDHPSSDNDEAPSATPGQESAANAVDDARLATIRTALNPLLIRDRRHQLLLTRGEVAVANGDTAEGIANFQALLDAPQDAFYWNPDAAQPLGAQINALREVRSWPVRSREMYERHCGPAAHELWHRYLESRDQRLLYELCRRFGHTAAARNAAVQELLLARDAGRSDLAAEWGRVLAADPFHWDQLSPALQQLVRRQIGSAQQALKVAAEEMRSLQETPDGRTAHWYKSDSPSVDATPPYPVPLWSTRFDASVSPADRSTEHPESLQQRIDELLHNWLADRIDRRRPIASANEAVVAGDTLIVRDFSRLNAFDLTTGQPLWTFGCNASFVAHLMGRLSDPATRTSAGSLDFDALFAENAVFGRLTTDGGRVFVLDQVEVVSPRELTESVGTPGASSASAQPYRPNQLVALPVRPGERDRDKSPTAVPEVEPLWTRGAQSSLPDDELARHIFLGRPLCVDDRLFILAEADRQIRLVALEVATGHTLWRQNVALVSQSAESDTLRPRTACSPLYSEGVVLCPTEIGVVVGVDALTGRLEWVYDHLDEEQRNNSGRWIFASGRKSGRLPLPNHAFVRDGRLVHLPMRSEMVHCIDVRTGVGVWKAPRLDSHVIAGVTQSIVLLLGDRECRALCLEDGSTLWRSLTPEPAGLGFAAAGHYYLPTSGGPCLAIDLSSGQVEGRRFSRLLHDIATRAKGGALQTESVQHDSGESRPHYETQAHLIRSMQASPAGNLTASRGLVVATTPLGVSVFRQAGPMLTELQTAEAQTLSDDELLTQAELLLTLGNDDAAGRMLEKLVSQSTDAGIQRPAERLLREILYAQLEHSDAPEVILERLARLTRSDQQRLRWLVSRIDVALTMGDAPLLVDSVQQFLSLPPSGLIAIDGESYFVSPRQCVWERLSRLHDEGSRDLSFAVSRHIAAQAEQLRQADDPEALEQFAAVFAGWDPALPVRSRLAELWIDAGRHQEAELLLLDDQFDSRGQSGPHRQHRHYERAQLARLYRQRGLGSMPRPSDVPAMFVHEPPPPRLAVDSLTTAAEPGYSVVGTALVALDSRSPHRRFTTGYHRTAALSEVHIEQHLCSDRCGHSDRCVCADVRRLHSQVRRRIFPTQSECLVVLDCGTRGDDDAHSRLIIADRDANRHRAEVDVPAAYWQAPQTLTPDAGHVMVVGGDIAFGVSLLEGNLLWTVEPQHAGTKREKIKVGPVGADYCVLQTPRELRVVHPATGQTLWLRTDLPPGVGLPENDITGIIGDSRTLAVFDADQLGFTLYDTQSGRELGRGRRPDIANGSRRQRWAVGRRLVELVSTATGSRLVVWDSREHRVVFDIPLKERLVALLPNEQDFAYVTDEGRLQILNIPHEQLQLDIAVPESPAGRGTGDAPFHSKGLVAFSDSSRWYVNFVTDGERGPARTVAAEDHLSFPNVRVRGRVIAIDRITQEVLWDQKVTDACLPLRRDAALPVLVFIRESREESTHGRRGVKDQHQRLILEVQDASTGALLARRDDLELSQLVDFQIADVTDAARRADVKRLRLAGLHSHVDITLAPPPADPLMRTAAKESDTAER